MKYKNILLILLCGVGVAFLVWGGILFFKNDNGPSVDIPGKGNPPEWKLNLWQKVQEDVKKKMGEGYPKGFLSQEFNNVVAAIYLPNSLLAEEVSNINQLNHPEEKTLDKQTRGGVIIFQIKNGEVKKIWESQEVMGDPFGRAEFKDLNGDGGDELLVWWSNGKSEKLWIYKWFNSDFKLISPFEEFTELTGEKTQRFVFAGNNIQIDDVDSDKTYEIMLPFTKIIKFLPDEEGFLTKPVEENYIRTYKWDGTEKPYYLWKEEKVGEDKPERVEP
jgi:hypothetical protein